MTLDTKCKESREGSSLVVYFEVYSECTIARWPVEVALQCDVSLKMSNICVRLCGGDCSSASSRTDL